LVPHSNSVFGNSLLNLVQRNEEERNHTIDQGRAYFFELASKFVDVFDELLLYLRVVIFQSYQVFGVQGVLKLS
jgi:hypothetical protein